MPQADTEWSPANAIMESKEFALGVADVRAGRDYHPDYEIWAKDNRSWNYERGRQWACVAPRNVALKRNGSVTAEAKKWWPHEVVHAPLRRPISNDIVGIRPSPYPPKSPRFGRKTTLGRSTPCAFWFKRRWRWKIILIL